MKRFTYLLLAATLFVPAVGCKQQTATAGAVAPTFYSQAATAMNGFSTTLLQAQSLFTTAYQEQLVDLATYQKGQQVFMQIGVSGEAIVSALQSAQPKATIEAQINALIAQVGSVPQAFAIKNPQSQAAFTALANSLVAILQTVESQVSATGTPVTPAVPGK